MSSSIGNSSLLNLALLNQLLQRAGTETGATPDGADAQAANSGNAFSMQADALLNAFDADGDGKLSRSELQTGFQKLSQGMRSFLIEQQSIASAAPETPGTQAGDAPSSAAPSSLNTEGDGTISPNQLVDRLLLAVDSGTAAAPSSTQSASADEPWDSWVQRMQGSDTGAIANQAAMSSLQRSMELDTAVTQLLQATDSYQAGASTTTD